ncbi:MAG: preprotein translocase subunit SecE [Flavobacteriales bacterium]|jgi:preprotein translocase subunit SecE
MNSKVDAKVYRLDSLKWIAAIALVVGGAVANSMYAEQFDAIYRTLVVVVLVLAACFISVQTEKGDAFWSLLKAAQIEVRKVVWPTRQETTQTTLLVVVVVLIAALILWGLDTFLGFLASLIIG